MSDPWKFDDRDMVVLPFNGGDHVKIPPYLGPEWRKASHTTIFETRAQLTSKIKAIVHAKPTNVRLLHVWTSCMDHVKRHYPDFVPFDSGPLDLPLPTDLRNIPALEAGCDYKIELSDGNARPMLLLDCAPDMNLVLPCGLPNEIYPYEVQQSQAIIHGHGDRAFRIEGILLDCAPTLLDVVDIKVGMRSQLCNACSLPGEIFRTHAEHVPRFRGDFVEPDTDVSVILRNRSQHQVNVRVAAFGRSLGDL